MRLQRITRVVQDGKDDLDMTDTEAFEVFYRLGVLILRGNELVTFRQSFGGRQRRKVKAPRTRKAPHASTAPR